MTYSEFFEIAKDKPWKAIPCHSGTECWCRIITVEDFERPDNEDSHISSWGSISKEFAEYLVELHNQTLESNSQLRFNSKEELFEFIQVNYEGRTLIDNEVCNIENFTDVELEREVEARGYYYFEDDSDIETYVEYSMDKYIFDSESDIIDWVKLNCSDFDELTTTASTGMYKSDCISLINDIAEKNGWEWLHRKLEIM